MQTSWTGQVTDAGIKNGILEITITYTSADGTNSFEKIIYAEAAQPDGWIEAQIQNKLDQLNSLDVYKQTLLTGNIVNQTYTIDPATTDLSQVASPVQTLQSQTSLI